MIVRLARRRHRSRFLLPRQLTFGIGLCGRIACARRASDLIAGDLWIDG